MKRKGFTKRKQQALNPTAQSEFETLTYVFKKWESGKSMPNNDFKKLIELLLPVIPSNLTSRVYEAIYEGLLNAFIDAMTAKVTEVLKGTNPSSYWTKLENHYFVEFTGEETPKNGITLTKPYGFDFISLKELDDFPTVASDLSLLIETILSSNLKRYQPESAATQLLIDWHYWGQQVWWNNPNYLEGDEAFLVHKALNTGLYMFTFISPNPQIAAIPDYFPFRNKLDQKSLMVIAQKRKQSTNKALCQKSKTKDFN